MSTYSINIGGITESTFRGNLDPNLFLNLIPNNTSQLIIPEDVRDAVYTIWDNISLKRVVASGSFINYIGIGGQNHSDEYTGTSSSGLKMFLGKPELSGIDIMNSSLLDYNDPNGDSDIIFYNLKPDSFGGSGADQQYTKVSFLAGDNSNDLFLTSPYMLSQQNTGGTAVHFTIYNEGGKLTIDSEEELVLGSPTTKVSLLYGTGSTGIATKPGGDIGDLQINLDNCVFGAISGSSSNVGDILIMGASNSAFWGSLTLNNVYTLNQVLTAGNTTNGEDIIITTTDSLYIGGTSNGELTFDGTYSQLSSDYLKISSDFLLINVDGHGFNKVLNTDGTTGKAIWASQSSANPGGISSNIQYNDSNSFGGTNLFKWDTSYSSLNINVSTATQSVAIKANSEGALYVNTNGTNGGVVVNDGTNVVFKIRTDGTKSIYFDSVSEYNMVFGSNAAGIKNKYTFYNGSSLEHMTFVPNSGTEEFRIDYESGTTVYSLLSFSPSDSKGMYLGSKYGHGSVSIGDFSSPGTYNSSLVVYSIDYAASDIMLRSSMKSLVVGDVSKTSISLGMVSTVNQRALGINVTPEIDFDLYGIRGIRPQESIINSGAYYYITDIASSYIVFNDNGIPSTLHRIGEFIGSLVCPHGTTIEIWNRTTSTTVTINLINEYFSGVYDMGQYRNIYSQIGGNNYPFRPGTMIRFVYLDVLSDSYLTPLTIDSSWNQLKTENGIWHMEI